MYKTTIKDYQRKAPFTSFLPGISGIFGKPLWTFYANRGQLMVSFGVNNKDGAIMEFFPAIAGYMYEKVNGFKTFVKIDDSFYSFFSEPNENQQMHIFKDKVMIEEFNKELNLSVTITYFTLPNEPISALARRVVIKNLNNDKRNIELLDGLTQILPSGIDYGGYKAVSNLLQSWMEVVFEENYAFYKLRGSTSDSPLVVEVTNGNFFMSQINGKKAKLVADIKKVFDYDYSYQMPHGFIKGMNLSEQVTVNQVPSAFSYYKGKIEEEIVVESLFGYVDNAKDLDHLAFNKDYLTKKEEENFNLIEDVTNELQITTANQDYDNYMQQNLLDNLLRGGRPISFNTLSGKVNYHLYSRKHGDPERDYNFFVIEPTYFSQGNGNFRDVLQNRRNDNFFYKDLESFNIKHFYSLIQADGYNPLAIEGIKFIYYGKANEILKDILNKPFTPGVVVQELINKGYSKEESLNELKQIMANSEVSYQAIFGEGFWQDHFTYLYDLIENYLRIYPDYEEKLLFDEFDYLFFTSPVDVKPRKDKSYLNNNKVRQYDALRWKEDKSRWLEIDGKPVKVNLASKILTLILNKYGLLDPKSIGIMYEAEKPGWNDALNGLPGLFGSGISEMIELLRITSYFKESLDKYKKDNLTILSGLDKLMDNYLKEDGFDFVKRIEAVELYRENIENQSLKEVSIEKIKEVINKIFNILQKAFEKAQHLSDIIPTYLTYDVTEYKKLNQTGFQNYQMVMPLKYEINPVKPFLEAPARSLKILSEDKAKSLYEKVKETELYDQKLKCYKTSVSLDEHTNELGRIRAFTKGWLERESNFLHMTYKYLYGLLKAGLYDTYYKEIYNNYTAFMDIEVYKRNPYENSSFIATSNNPDYKNHGRGFVARLSGSTAEALSMYTYMFFGKQPFVYDNGLKMVFKPILDKNLFKDNKVICKFYNTTITYINLRGENLYDLEPDYIEVVENNTTRKLSTNYLEEEMAKSVRNGDDLDINVIFK